MKVHSNICPESNFSIERHGDNAEIIFYENIEKCGKNDFLYEEYRILTTYRENLEQSVTENCAEWLEKAKTGGRKKSKANLSARVAELIKENRFIKEQLKKLGGTTGEEK